MTHQIKIGLSPCFMYPDPSRSVFGQKSLTYMENDMVSFFADEDAVPLLIPKLKPQALAKFIDNLDGVVFQGGSDLSPSSYGDQPIDASRWPGDKIRDDYELEILDLALKKKKPVLGICRGLQLINTYYGGTLFQDLPTQVGKTIVHRDPIAYDHIHHPVDLQKQSLLSEIYQSDKILVNSIHHQGIKTLGEGLLIEATSPQDQIIEAFRHKNMDENFVLAVQWHPEFSHTLEGKITSPIPLLQYYLKVLARNS